MRNFLFVVTMILLVGCASNSGPTTNVGIVNGKYAMRTVIPNNNKGKIVQIVSGQDYHCKHKNDTGKKFSFDMQSRKDTFMIYNYKMNGKKIPNNPAVRKLVSNKKVGFVQVNGKWIARLSDTELGKISIVPDKKWLKKDLGWIFECTQTTNNPYIYTKTMTKDEIDLYKHNQQIAVQQRAIDSADYNAVMSSLQAQTAQTNYNTQQMMNRMNTYKVNVYHY